MLKFGVFLGGGKFGHLGTRAIFLGRPYATPSAHYSDVPKLSSLSHHRDAETTWRAWGRFPIVLEQNAIGNGIWLINPRTG